MSTPLARARLIGLDPAEARIELFALHPDMGYWPDLDDPAIVDYVYELLARMMRVAGQEEPWPGPSAAALDSPETAVVPRLDYGIELHSRGIYAVTRFPERTPVPATELEEASWFLAFRDYVDGSAYRDTVGPLSAYLECAVPLPPPLIERLQASQMLGRWVDLYH